MCYEISCFAGMFLKHLHLLYFKNIDEAQWNFSKNIIAFIGKNGVGKTNVLDAIYYLAMTKSYFSSSDIQNIQFGKDFFLIHGKFENDNREFIQVNCNVEKGKGKLVSVNEKTYSKLAEHIGKIPIVFITPYDIGLITQYADTRRRFIDALISKFDKEYLNALVQYHQHLQNRNSIIKQGDVAYKQQDLIEIYDAQIAKFGEIILSKRILFFKEIEDSLISTYKQLQDNNENLTIRYISTIQNNYLSELQNSLPKDIKMGYTTIGIHRDDFEIMLNAHPAKIYASQGQLKTIVFALKWLELMYLYQKTKEHPILMIDDIYDKLDTTRLNKINALINSGIAKQIFITDNNYERIKNLFEKENTQIIKMNK